jgi:uncharacterized PurR-regulated membrane protein YhhQ (DUF165 family)
MEKYLITSSAVGKNKIRKFVFFGMMCGLYLTELLKAKITDPDVTKFATQFVKLHLHQN